MRTGNSGDWRLRALQGCCVLAIALGLLSLILGHSNLLRLLGTIALVGYGYFIVHRYLSGGTIISGLGRPVPAIPEEKAERFGYALLWSTVILSLSIWSILELAGLVNS